MILDKPIKTREEDLLGHETLAIRIAEAMRNLPSDALSESFVVGIEGSWGSGKTSLINLVLEKLNPSGFPVVKFNPWSFSDQNELVTDFFNSVAETLKDAETEKGEGIAESIRSYFPKLLKGSSIDISPRVSFAGFELNFASVYKTGYDTLEKRKEKIKGLLGDMQKPIVIVIDDIDRLESQETRLVFKLVKMTANFPNTVFLLAYDRDRVGGMLTDDGVPGEEFLKKIVQLSFPLPRVDQKDLFGILFKEVDGIVVDFGADTWDQRRWEDLFESGLKRLFPTVRDIKRYLNSVRLDLEIIGKEEVNPVDFLGIEAIRVFAPGVYFAMAREKSTFAFPATDEIYHIVQPLPPTGGWGKPAPQDSASPKAICEKIIKERSPEGLSDTVTEIVRELFPQIEDLYSDGKYGDLRKPQLDDWTQNLRVCSGAVFDKYFSLSVVFSVLSERALRDFLANVNNREESAQKLEKFHKEGKLQLLLNRLHGNLENFLLEARQLENLLVILFDSSDLLGNDPAGLPYKISRLIPREKRFESLSGVLNLTTGVFPPTWFVDLLIREIEEYESSSEYHRAERFLEGPLLAGEEVRGLSEICAEKIRKSAENGTLEKDEGLGYLLDFWKRSGSEKPVKDYVAGLLKTDDGLPRFLKACIWVVDVNGRKINEQVMELVNPGELLERINKIDTTGLEEEKIGIIRSCREFLQSVE